MSFNVAGRFAIVTDGASEIGHACAEMLADDSAKYARREVHLFPRCIDASLRTRRPSPSGRSGRISAQLPAHDVHPGATYGDLEDEEFTTVVGGEMRG